MAFDIPSTRVLEGGRLTSEGKRAALVVMQKRAMDQSSSRGGRGSQDELASGKDDDDWTYTIAAKPSTVSMFHELTLAWWC